MILRLIKKHIYKLGFNPKQGSIFFSPSKAAQLACIDMSKAIRDGIEQGIKLNKENK